MTDNSGTGRRTVFRRLLWIMAVLAILAAGAAVFGVFVLPYWMYPGGEAEIGQARASLQGGLLTAAAAFTAVAGGLIALDETRQANAEIRRANAEIRRANENTHVRELYGTAIGQLGADRVDIRLGGIYALERVARDSTADQRTVVEVLSAFVRVHSIDRSTTEVVPDAETWVTDKARKVLAGKAGDVATGIRRRATYNGYNAQERKGADTCADYLDAKAPWLGYATALAGGWPIATGVIEGACRHLVKDRMDRTGARWGLDGAETILLLRALITNGDFDGYWQFHLTQERHRNHDNQYADNRIPP